MSNAKYIQEGYTAITPYLHAKLDLVDFLKKRVRRRSHAYFYTRRLRKLSRRGDDRRRALAARQRLFQRSVDGRSHLRLCRRCRCHLQTCRQPRSQVSQRAIRSDLGRPRGGRERYLGQHLVDRDQQRREVSGDYGIANTQPTMPPGIVLYQIGIGHYFSRALALAAKLGVADLLNDGPRFYTDLAEATQTHAPSLNRMMRLLASVGVFEERDNGIFALTSLGELLRAGVPGSMRSAMLLFAGIGIQDAWKELEYCVQTGEPAFRRNSPDADPFSQIRRRHWLVADRHSEGEAESARDRLRPAAGRRQGARQDRRSGIAGAMRGRRWRLLQRSAGRR